MALSAERHLVQKGPMRSVTCAICQDNKSPAKAFLDSLGRHELTRFAVSFQRIANDGRIGNPQHFHKIDGEIWEFKCYQHRIGCFQDGREWVLTHGFVKKGDRWPKPEVDRAKRIMAEDMARKAQTARK